jgi:hypothetical protein
MEIPEITEGQVKLMMTVCFDPTMGVFSQHEALPTDAPDDYRDWTQANRDADRLSELGFLKNITEEHREHVERAVKQAGRRFQVYEITALGRAMFQATTSPLIH